MDKQQKKELAAAYKMRKQTGGIYGIRNDATGKLLLFSTTDLKGSRNRFDFSQATDSCFFEKLKQDWKTYGKDGFSFEALEELEKGAEQTDAEFREDLQALEDLWKEKLDPDMLY